MKIETEFFSKVTIWEKNRVIVEVENEEQFKELVKRGELVTKCDDIEFLDTEYLWETLADIGDYEYDSTLDNYEILEQE